MNARVDRPPPPGSNSPARTRRSRATWWHGAALLGVIAATLLLRGWQLNMTPPYLWWDEASQGLDARELLHGTIPIFYPRALGKEPLYIYLSVPFVALWDGLPLATRAAGALLGTLTALALFVAGRALWRAIPHVGLWAGLAAAALWAVNYWPQSINRIGFQVNTFPLVLTMAISAWLNWTAHPDRRRALFAGFMGGLTLYTYLAARITPLLWPLLYLLLPRDRRRGLRGTLMPALFAYGATALPLTLYFLRNPDQFLTRARTVGSLPFDAGVTAQASRVATEGWLVLQAFLGLDGDPLLRHNLPHRAPFSAWVALLFVIGVGCALWALRRRAQWAVTLLLWFGLLCLPTILAAEENPHFTRLFGALPAALLLVAYPVGWVAARAGRYRTGMATALGTGLVLLLLVGDGTRTVADYFGSWRHDPDLYIWYQGDYWEVGEYARAHPDMATVVPVLTDPYVFAYAFDDANLVALLPGVANVEMALATAATGPRLAVARWDTGVEEQADPRGVATFFATREGTPSGETKLARNTITDYVLDANPQFAAVGQTGAAPRHFGGGVTLTGARFGPAQPNPDRSAGTVLPGTDVWLILDWTLDWPQPAARVATELVDAAGHPLAPADAWLFPEPIDTWQAGAVVHTYHLLHVPETQPPGPIMLRVRLYDDTTLQPLLPVESEAPDAEIGAMTVLPGSPDRAPVAPPIAVAADMTPGLRLLGHDPLPERTPAGLGLTVKLYLATTGAAVPDALAITLGPPDAPIATASIPVPASVTTGRPFHLFVDLPVPPETPTGDDYTITIAAPGAAAPVDLGPVTIAGRAHLFDPPAMAYSVQSRAGSLAALAGVTPEGSLAVPPGARVALTLAWEALATADRDWVRFVHLLDGNGTLVAQQDSPPCDGACRPRTWLPGEYLLDRVNLTLPDELPAGDYTLITGWYDPVTAVRLPVTTPSGPSEWGDAIRVPVKVTVTAP